MYKKFICVGVVVFAVFLSCKPPQSSMSDEEILTAKWEDLMADARGKTVNWYLWGGSSVINTFVEDLVASYMKEHHDITVHMVPIEDTALAVSKVLAEHRAEKHSQGSVDLIWINGENFRRLREEDLLFGPWTDLLPHMDYVDRESPTVLTDFGYPVEGYESPFGSAQFAIIYDSAKVETPPLTLRDLLEWAREHPGLFTYPAPPDFTGSAFVRQAFYTVFFSLAGTSQKTDLESFSSLQGGFHELPFDQDFADATLPILWDELNAIEPYLWRQGDTYPEDSTQLELLYANGEVYFDMTYHPNDAALYVSQGRYPESSRTYAFREGTMVNTHFLAIPYNASNKTAAMLLANALLSPELQAKKNSIEHWGDLTILSMDRLNSEQRELFGASASHESAPSLEELNNRRIAELSTEWLDAIEQGWIENVLKK